MANSQREIEGFFRRMIEAGQQSSEISMELSAQKTAQSLLAALIGLLVLSRSRRDRELLKSVAESTSPLSFFDFVLNDYSKPTIK